MTEDGPAAQRVKAVLAAKRWSRARLATAASIDPATVTDFLNGKRWPHDTTLAKIEDALSLTPGTLAELGEDRPSATALGLAESREVAAGQLDDATPEQLLVALTAKVDRLRRENDELREQLAQQPPPDTGVTRLDFNQARGGQRRYAANTGPDKMDDLEAPDDDPDDYP